MPINTLLMNIGPVVLDGVLLYLAFKLTNTLFSPFAFQQHKLIPRLNIEIPDSAPVSQSSLFSFSEKSPASLSGFSLGF